MTEHLLYTTLARYYDVIYREYLENVVPRLVDAYEQVFREYAERVVRDVLDIACGTGGPSLELARRGYNVVGVDLHEEMIRIAMEKAAKAELSASFRVADARDLARVFPTQVFDAVTMFFSSINYMTSLSDLASLMRSAHYVLRMGGVFVADAPNPYSSFYRHGSRGENTAIAWSVEHREAHERIVLLDWREVTDWLNGVVRLMRLVTIAGETGETKSYLVSDALRYYTGTELELVAQNTGFRKARTLCYQGGRVSEKSSSCPRLVFVAVK